MDWKYKHLSQQRTFASPPEEVFEAARAYVSQSLGWQITETPEGFSASGMSFAHASIAKFHFQPTTGGTDIRIELLVERASSIGFMLVDIGGYYTIQMVHWLDGIQWQLHQAETAGSSATASAPPDPAVLPAKSPAALLFNGCLIFIVIGFGLYFVFMFVAAWVGLLTGHLVWIGRGSGGSTLHGITARIVATVILLVYVFVGWRIARMLKR